MSSSKTARRPTVSDRLADALDTVMTTHRPEIVFYLAGADPYEGDRLGRLKLTIDGLRQRDELVLAPLPARCRARRHHDERRLRHQHRQHRRDPREHDPRAAVHLHRLAPSGTCERLAPAPAAHSGLRHLAAPRTSAPTHSDLMPRRFRLLTEDHVKSLLPMPDLITAMESAVARFSAGDVLQPVRTVLSVGPTHAYFGLMPAFIPQPASLGAKLVTVFNGNHARGLPSHLATIVLLDPDTGSLIALMDGRYITEARTAAVSAVSARHLSRPGRLNAGHHRHRRAGTEPPRGVRRGARVERCPRLVAHAEEPRPLRRRHGWPRCRARSRRPIPRKRRCAART